jgi:hypothetical protein
MKETLLAYCLAFGSHEIRNVLFFTCHFVLILHLIRPSSYSKDKCVKESCNFSGFYVREKMKASWAHRVSSCLAFDELVYSRNVKKIVKKVLLI